MFENGVCFQSANDNSSIYKAVLGNLSAGQVVPIVVEHDPETVFPLD